MSGTVCCFSTSTPRMRASSSDNVGTAALIASLAAVRVVRSLSLAAVFSGECRLADLIGVDHEARQGSARILIGVDMVDLQRVNRENVAVRPVALRWTGPAIAGLAEIGARLDGAARRLAASGIAGAGGKRVDVGGDVEHHPMPPAAAGRSVGIVDGQREAFRAGGRILPFQRRRNVAALAAEPLEHLRFGYGRARLDFGARQRERA